VAGTRRPDLRGPVGIVQETSKQPAGSLLTFLAMLAAYLTPFLAGVTLFDAVTARVFQAAYPAAATTGLRGYRLERLRQAILLASSGYITATLLIMLVSAGVPAALVLALWAMPAGTALYPLTWIAAKEVSGRSIVALPLFAALFVPCVPILVALFLISKLQRQLRADGFVVHLLSVEAPPV
jgi:hypothetical protein